MSKELQTYLATRIGQLLLIVFVAVSINFIIPRLLPGDPVMTALARLQASGSAQSVDIQAVAAAYREKYGLDSDLFTQYVNYWADLFRLDLGVSFTNFPQKVSTMIGYALPWSVGLLATATLIAFAVGSLLGARLAWPGAGRPIKSIVPLMMILTSIPFYLLAIILIYFFAVVLRWLPPGGGVDTTRVMRLDWATVEDVLRHALLPCLAIVLGNIGFWALGMRSQMVSVLGEDYITFAEAKGLHPRRIFLRYGMRNALLPQITALALSLGSVVSGAVLVEVVFNYPGLGNLLYVAIRGQDYFVIQGVVLMLIVALAVLLFLVELIYPLLDPRIRR
jgi:peptide/nickel transport system permease protein